ncbi:MAG: hypothetical protein RR962_03255 [Hafnia sp.]
MKQILRIAPLAALMLAGITLSAQATTPPDSVGDVTLYGNITANSPMWQWTVNDYSGPRLNAKPSTADTSVAGKVTYPLPGQWFIAASGYLPSYVPGKIGAVISLIGNADITTLTSPDGPVVLTTTGTTATVSIPATGTDASGAPIVGNLVLNADELRGGVFKIVNGTAINAGAFLTYRATATPATSGGSCWVGRGADTVANLTRTQTATALPVYTDAGPNSASGAAAAVNSAFATADAAGVVRYAGVGTYTTNNINTGSATAAGCSTSSSSLGGADTQTADEESPVLYKSAAHVLALQPASLSFPKAASGVWNATLTVTAYQM